MSDNKIILGWEMTIGQYRAYFKANREYQAFCAALFSGCDTTRNNKDSAIFHTAMAFLLNGTSTKPTGNSEMLKTYGPAVGLGDGPGGNMTQCINRAVRNKGKEDADINKNADWLFFDLPKGDRDVPKPEKYDARLDWKIRDAYACFDRQAHRGPAAERPLPENWDQLTNLLDTLLTPLPKDLVTKQIRDGGCRQIILTGAPGTGKTYIAQQIAEEAVKPGDGSAPWGGTLTGERTGQAEAYTMVQFHPSYDYTDFVEGLRPVMQEGPDKGQIAFAKMDGTFKAFCRKVVAANAASGTDPASKDAPLYFFIIDEINRANLSKVFGELMYCLEKDKRGTAHPPIQTQYQNLLTYDPAERCYLLPSACARAEKKKRGPGRPPAKEAEQADAAPKVDCFAGGFYIPENVVIIGTMNDIDRSVDSMDFALRRRFEWKEIMANEAILVNAFISGKYGAAIKENAAYLASCIAAINKAIEDNGARYSLNRQYFISQGQFSNLPGDPQTLREVVMSAWEYRIEPLLREYLRGESEKDLEAFIGSQIRFDPDKDKTSVYSKLAAALNKAEAAAEKADAAAEKARRSAADASET